MSKSVMYRFAIFLFLIFILPQTMNTAFATQDYENAGMPNMTMASKNFWQLNQALAFYQEAVKHPWPEIPEYPALLKPHTKSETVQILRKHLRMTGDLAPENDNGSNVYDSQLRDAVRVFQARHGMKTDGVVGKDTRMELNVPPEIRMRQIALNMQRWANLSGKLTDRYIMVNIPDFHMYLVENDQIVLSLRAIVGKPDLQTPELSSKITRIVFNPYWNIPDKIAQKDIAPKMLDDPDYMYKMHIRAFRQEDNDKTEVDPNYINWQSAVYNGVNYHLRQDPGPDNALGQIKFEFQNNHNVYMHDTSAKNLFDEEIRSFSHGCIRLENPLALADYLLQDNPNWNDERIEQVLLEGKTTYVKVMKPIPIFVTYITAWIDGSGRVNFRDDLYQLDEENAGAERVYR